MWQWIVDIRSDKEVYLLFVEDSIWTIEAPARDRVSCLWCQWVRSPSVGAAQRIQGWSPAPALKLLRSLQVGDSRRRGSRMMGRGRE